MNSQSLLEKLKSSEEFKKFIKENPNAYFCSGFFMIDLENKKGSDNKYHFDFFVPDSKKTFSFELEAGIRVVPLERYEQVLEKISSDLVFDFDEIEKIILRGMEEKRIKNKIQKMIFSLQNLEKRDLLFGTIFISGFGMVKVNIDLKEKRITDFEKKSFWDMFNIMRRE
jgi:hypothetical protein